MTRSKKNRKNKKKDGKKPDPLKDAKGNDDFTGFGGEQSTKGGGSSSSTDEDVHDSSVSESRYDSAREVPSVSKDQRNRTVKKEGSQTSSETPKSNTVSESSSDRETETASASGNDGEGSTVVLNKGTPKSELKHKLSPTSIAQSSKDKLTSAVRPQQQNDTVKERRASNVFNARSPARPLADASRPSPAAASPTKSTKSALKSPVIVTPATVGRKLFNVRTERIDASPSRSSKKETAVPGSTQAKKAVTPEAPQTAGSTLPKPTGHAILTGGADKPKEKGSEIKQQPEQRDRSGNRIFSSSAFTNDVTEENDDEAKQAKTTSELKKKKKIKKKAVETGPDAVIAEARRQAERLQLLEQSKRKKYPDKHPSSTKSDIDVASDKSAAIGVPDTDIDSEPNSSEIERRRVKKTKEKRQKKKNKRKSLEQDVEVETTDPKHHITKPSKDKKTKKRQRDEDTPSPETPSTSHKKLKTSSQTNALNGTPAKTPTQKDSTSQNSPQRPNHISHTFSTDTKKPPAKSATKATSSDPPNTTTPILSASDLVHDQLISQLSTLIPPHIHRAAHTRVTTALSHMRTKKKTYTAAQLASGKIKAKDQDGQFKWVGSEKERKKWEAHSRSEDGGCDSSGDEKVYKEDLVVLAAAKNLIEALPGQRAVGGKSASVIASGGITSMEVELGRIAGEREQEVARLKEQVANLEVRIESMRR